MCREERTVQNPVYEESAGVGLTNGSVPEGNLFEGAYEVISSAKEVSPYATTDNNAYGVTSN